MKKLVQSSFDDLQPFMGLVLPKLEIACRFSIGKYTAEDIFDFVKKDIMQIWLAFDDEVIDGFIITQIVGYPKIKSLRFICLMGVGIEGWQKFMCAIGDWLPFVRQVEDWGKSIGCSLSQIECPAPWENYMTNYGYSRGHVILNRELQ